jgi:hypothetical protein
MPKATTARTTTRTERAGRVASGGTRKKYPTADTATAPTRRVVSRQGRRRARYADLAAMW